MAVMVRYTKEQRDAQAQIICDIFGLENANDVLADFRMESVGSEGTLLTISLVKRIDTETATALLNGRPLRGAEG